jgi:hypothetical protein
MYRGFADKLSEETIAAKVAVRMRRQERLKHLEVWAIIDESILKRVVGDRQVMEQQLRRLAELSVDPNVTLQILPFGAGAHAGMEGPFMIMEFPRRGDTVIGDVAYFETAAGPVWVDQAGGIEKHSRRFERLQAQAIDPAASRRRLLREADDLGKPAGGEG